MTLQEARQTLAGYLSGASPPWPQVEEAWQAVQADSEHVRHVHEELGLAGIDGNDCAVLREHAALLSELPAQQRVRDFPQLSAHLDECASCRHFFASIQPAFAELPDQARRTFQLIEPITLVVGKGGMQSRGGPPPLPQDIQAQAAGAEELGALPPMRQWRLADEQTGQVVELTVRRRVGAEVEVVVGFEGDGIIALGDLRLEVVQLPGNLLFVSGPLADFAREPVVLGLGAWRLRIQARGRKDGYMWEILIMVEPE